MKPNIEHSFIHFVYSKARESESLDINNQRKSFVRRNGRFLLAYPLTVFVLFSLSEGYNTLVRDNISQKRVSCAEDST